MRPGQVNTNDFEAAILERIASNDALLKPLIGKLHVLSRTYTGVGSFTNFACSETVVELGDHAFGLSSLIRMPGVPNGMGAVLFCKSGKPECLETFTYGDDHWEGVHEGFSIE